MAAIVDPAPEPSRVYDDNRDGDHGQVPLDGGFRAWRAVLGSFLIQTSSFGYVFACGVFQYHYKEVMLPDASSQQLGWITTAAEFLILGAGVPVGHLVDRYGTRLVIAPFATISVVALILLSLCTQYWQVLLCQGVLFGIGCSGTVLPSIVCVTQWFSTRKGLAVGLASSGSSIGGIYFTIMITDILGAQGFAAAVRWSTLVVGCSMAIGAICCEGPFPSGRTRQKEQKKADYESSDSELGLTTPAKLSIPESRDRWASLRHNGSAWAAFCLGAFFCMLTQMVPFNYLPQMAASSGMNVVLAQYTTAVANGGSTIGRVIPGILSDHLGQFNVMIMVTSMSAVSILAVWLPVNYHPSDGGIIFFSAFYGFVSGGYVSLLSPCVVALVDGRVADLNTKFGIACGFVAIGALLGIPITGAVHDGTGNFTGLIVLSGALAVTATFFMILARIKKGGWAILAKV